MDFFTTKPITKAKSITDLQNLGNSDSIDIKIPWIEKYRPKNSEEILLEPFIKQKIEKILSGYNLQEVDVQLLGFISRKDFDEKKIKKQYVLRSNI